MKAKGSIPPALALVFLLLATVGVAADRPSVSPPDGFAAALAELQAEHENLQTTGSTVAHMTAVNEAFFARVDLGKLALPDIADLVRLNVFAYGDAAHARALSTADRLSDLADQPTLNGAQAAVLRLQLAGTAGVDNRTRAEWAAAFLRHPALPPLLQSEFGDLALESACRSARTASEKEFVLGLAVQLDAARSHAAVGAIQTYWDTIKRLLPEGERRQALRLDLVRYLTAVLNDEKGDVRTSMSHESVENLRALLTGAEAQGQLLGLSGQCRLQG